MEYWAFAVLCVTEPFGSKHPFCVIPLLQHSNTALLRSSSPRAQPPGGRLPKRFRTAENNRI
jgi:hypothetical protein